MEVEHPQVVQLASLGRRFDAQLAARWRVLPLYQEDDPQARLRALAPDAPLIVTSVRIGLRPEVLAALSAVRAICSWGVGCDMLPLDAARARGIAVSNTPDVQNECVADMAFGLLLASARRIPACDRYVRDGRWNTLGHFPLTTRVWGKRLGVLGLGRIGKAIARRAQGFGMPVRYHNRHARADLPAYGFEPSLTALAAWSDFLVVACPGGAETRHLVDAAVLRALGPGGTLVNIARGTVVDEAALVQALQAGELGGAGLDVFEHEPAVPAVLQALDQVVLAPHTASGTHETRASMSQLVLDNLLAWEETGRLLTPVSL
ncbi:2-hydroxyacid dehydrogenase [Castellaniella caeni]|uniref:2-hydroxyacid dehydrogenase n=1 Tax=Castellaniella caeni TaxID=266123 RepID=UPI0008314EB1|nr:2-hydroxyacid dehydrogenase [Castellaniella caeni]